MKTDRRVKYTQRVLKEALIEILNEKPIDRVTVKEICDRADINRSTFYVHYGSPQELLESVAKEMYEKINEKKKDFDDIKTYMAGICDIMYENRELMKLFVKTGNIESMFGIAELWKNDFISMVEQKEKNRFEADAAFLFITCGAFAVLNTWLLGYIPMTRDQVVDKIHSLTMNGLNIYSKEE